MLNTKIFSSKVSFPSKWNRSISSSKKELGCGLVQIQIKLFFMTCWITILLTLKLWSIIKRFSSISTTKTRLETVIVGLIEGEDVGNKEEKCVLLNMLFHFTKGMRWKWWGIILNSIILICLMILIWGCRRTRNRMGIPLMLMQTTTLIMEGITMKLSKKILINVGESSISNSF